MPIKKYFLLICTIFLSATVFAHATDSADNCNSLGQLHYNNEKATVIIKATYQSIFRSPDEPILAYLQKRKRLKYHDYIRDCCGGTSVEFIPENCTTSFNATIKRGIAVDLNNLKAGTVIYCYCTVYTHIIYYKNTKPFFVINNIKLK